jgi:hydroxyacylglutathione hydrolase
VHRTKLHPDPNSAPAAASAKPRLRLATVPLGFTQTNAYAVWLEPDRSTQSTAWIIDPGMDPGPLLGTIRQHQLVPELIVLTHAHADHIAGLDVVASAFPAAKLCMHAAEADWLTDPELNLSIFLGKPIALRTRPARLLAHGDTLALGDRTFTVLHTPGHSPGSISLHSPADALAIVGDTLFAGSIGRTDFPHSDHQQLLNSIEQHLYTLPDATTLYPGHGPATTVQKERRTNPFVRA